MICSKKHIPLCIIIIVFINTSCFFTTKSAFKKNPQLLSEIEADLASDNWSVRLSGLDKLYNVKEYQKLPESEQLILQASFDEQALVRVQAVYMLTELNKLSTNSRIITIAQEDVNDNVKWEAIISLGILKERRSIPLLIEAVESDDWLIREAAYKSINRIALSSDKEQLRHILVNGILDPVNSVKRAALYNIPFYDPDIYNAIKSVIIQSNIPENLLIACFNAVAGYALDPIVREVIVNNLANRNPQIRIYALRTLRQDNKYPKR